LKTLVSTSPRDHHGVITRLKMIPTIAISTVNKNVATSDRITPLGPSIFRLLSRITTAAFPNPPQRGSTGTQVVGGIYLSSRAEGFVGECSNSSAQVRDSPPKNLRQTSTRLPVRRPGTLRRAARTLSEIVSTTVPEARLHLLAVLEMSSFFQLSKLLVLMPERSGVSAHRRSTSWYQGALVSDPDSGRD
jgi:hypothetical protein